MLVLLWSCFRYRYLRLVRSSDGPGYARTEFRLDRIENFALIIVTKQHHPQEHLLKAFHPIEVVLL